MKFFLPALLFLLASLTATAFWTRPAPPPAGLTPLVRMTDTHPQRGEEVATFNRLHPGFFLSVDTGLRPDKVLVQASSRIGPDLWDAYSGAQIQTYATAGLAWDLTERAAALGLDPERSVWPTARGEILHDGRQFAYPANITVPILVYNKNLFDAAGVPYPAGELTWDEFIALARRVAPPVAPGEPARFAVTGLSWAHFFYSARGEHFSADGTRPLFLGDAFRRAWRMHRDCVFKHRIMPTFLEARQMSTQGGFGSGTEAGLPSTNQFIDGRFAMMIVGKFALVNLRRAHAQQVTRLNGAPPESVPPAQRPLRLGSVRLPRFADTPPGYMIQVKSTVINALGPRREAALRVLAYQSSAEYSAIINRGVDGMPPNPAHVNVGLEPGVPDLAELEMHANSIAALPDGHKPRFSPYIFASDVGRLHREGVARMETNPALDVDAILRDVQAEAEALIRRNLRRDPDLRDRYRAALRAE